MHLWRLSMINSAYLYLRPWAAPSLAARLSQSGQFLSGLEFNEEHEADIEVITSVIPLARGAAAEAPS